MERATQAEEVSEGIESPLKSWGLFKSRGEWSQHMEQLPLVCFGRAVLRASNDEERLLRREGLKSGQ